MAALAVIGAGLGAGAAQAAPPADRAHTVLVKVDPAATASERADLAAALDADRSRRLGAGWHAYELSGRVELPAVRADLAASEADLAVALDAPLRPYALPNDPLLGPTEGGYQWALANTGAWGGGRPGADIGAERGWQMSRGAGEVVVAVADAGIDLSHPDLSGRIWHNRAEVPANGIDDDRNGHIDDVNGWNFAADSPEVFGPGDGDHGTHVAGVIGASQGNGIGIAGAAPNATIMPLKFIQSGVGSTSDAIAAIDYATRNGARVINASWGGSTPSPALCDAVAQAAAGGVVFVAAAGNAGTDNDAYPSWPASCSEPSLVAVAATDHADRLANYSNTGQASVDLAAPGDLIVSTLPGGGYGYKSGTSMAAPHTAAVAAQLAGVRADFTPAQIKQSLLAGASALPELSGRVASGRRLHLAGALSVATGAPVPGPEGAGADPPAARAQRLTLTLRARRSAAGRISVRLSASRRVRATLAVRAGRRTLGRLRVGAGPRARTVRLPRRIARRMSGGRYRIAARAGAARASTRLVIRPAARIRTGRLAPGARAALRLSLSRPSKLWVTVSLRRRTVGRFTHAARTRRALAPIPARIARRMARPGRYTLAVNATRPTTRVRGRVILR